MVGMYPGDFYIVDITYDCETGLGKDFSICVGRLDCLGPSFLVTREELIFLIEDGSTVELIPPENERGRRRIRVKVVELDGIKYLRTDGESISADFY